MLIRNIEETVSNYSDITGKVMDEILKAIDLSRFRIKNLERVSRVRTNDAIKIVQVRLKDSKAYCGNHPGSCEIGGAHRKGAYLEGADWVEFNDLINDVLDSLSVSADAATSVCVIRYGDYRRTHYGMERDFWGGDGAIAQWEMEDPLHVGNFMGHDPKDIPCSTYPEGTPGMYKRNDSNYYCVG